MAAQRYPWQLSHVEPQGRVFLRPSDRSLLYEAKGKHLKCTECREMLTEEEAATHKCDPCWDLLGDDVDENGRIKEAYARGKYDEQRKVL